MKELFENTWALEDNGVRIFLLTGTASFEPKCREVCTEEEYKTLKKAFFEKDENLKKLRESVEKSPVV